MSSRAPLVALAVLAGLVFQAPADGAELHQGAGTDCPTGIPGLPEAAGRGQPSTDTVTCRGWGGQDFAVGTAPATAMVRYANPRVGEACADLHYYRVTFVEDAGGIRASFAFAGGAGRGSFPLATDQVGMIATADGYVTDVQLGSYEPLTPSRREAVLMCRLNPTYHLYCPATQGLDQFCYTWVRRAIGLRGLAGCCRRPAAYRAIDQAAIHPVILIVEEWHVSVFSRDDDGRAVTPDEDFPRLLATGRAWWRST